MENSNVKSMKLIDKFKILFVIVFVFSILGSIAARIGTHNYESHLDSFNFIAEVNIFNS